MMKSRRVGCRQAGPLTSHAMSRDGRLKMRPRQLMLFCAVLAALPGSAVGQTEPASAMGSALLASCQANEPGCGAYLQGVLDMMIVARKAECRAQRYDRAARSEERRVGKECVGTCRSRWSPDNKKKKHRN